MKKTHTIQAVILLGISIFLLVLVLGGNIRWLTDYWRTDNYTIYISVGRTLCALISVIVSLWFVTRVACPMSLRILLPTNLFLYLLLFMIMPGVLLTSNFSASGTTSFYGYLGSLLSFVAGTTLIASALHFDPQRELVTAMTTRLSGYDYRGTTYQLFLVLYGCGFAVALATTDFSVSVFAAIHEFATAGVSPEGEIAMARQAIYYEDGGSVLQAISSYCKVMVLPISSVFIIINGIIRGRRKETAVGALLMAITFIFLVASGSRRNALFVLVFILVAISLVRPLNVRYVAFSIAVAGIFLVVQTLVLGRMTYTGSSVGNVVKSANRAAERVFMTKGAGSQLVFEYIPRHTPFKMGTTIAQSLLGRWYTDDIFAIELFQFSTGGKRGTAGPQAFAEGYANFGVVGMLVVAFMLGGLVQGVSIFVVRTLTAGRNARRIVFAAYMVVLFAKTGYADIATFKSSGLHVLLCLMMVCYVITQGPCIRFPRRRVNRRHDGIWATLYNQCTPAEE